MYFTLSLSYSVILCWWKIPCMTACGYNTTIKRHVLFKSLSPPPPILFGDGRIIRCQVWKCRAKRENCFETQLIMIYIAVVYVQNNQTSATKMMKMYIKKDKLFTEQSYFVGFLKNIFHDNPLHKPEGLKLLCKELQ